MIRYGQQPAIETAPGGVPPSGSQPRPSSQAKRTRAISSGATASETQQRVS